MAEKFLEVLPSGLVVENEALVVSAGAADAGKIPALNAAGQFDATLIPSGVGSEDSLSIVASEAITAPALVNVFDDSGTMKIRYADASATQASRRAVGFVRASVALGASATMYFEGRLTGLTGLTPGAPVFLSGTTPGGAVSVAPTTSGHAVQPVGTALSATTLDFERGEPIVRA